MAWYWIVLIFIGYFFEHRIAVRDLEKLPGFKED